MVISTVKPSAVEVGVPKVGVLATVTESCVAAMLPLPAPSVKTPAATLKVAVVLFVAGVKVAV